MGSDCTAFSKKSKKSAQDLKQAPKFKKNQKNSKLASFDMFHSGIFIIQWETQLGRLHKGAAKGLWAL